MKTARQHRRKFVPEVHIVGSGDGPDPIGEMLKAAGWLVIYDPKPPMNRAADLLKTVDKSLQDYANRRRIQNQVRSSTKLEKRKDVKPSSIR